MTTTLAPSPAVLAAIAEPQGPNPATTTVSPASSMLVDRSRPSMTDWPVPCPLSNIRRVIEASAATTGKGSVPAAAI